VVSIPPSLWTATVEEPAPAAPPLDGDVHANVAVIGAGYTGLSTALHAAERGMRPIVLDAEEPGWGASGRNGGQVIPGLKQDPEELEQLFGRERGAALVKFAGGTADLVFDLIERHRIACKPVRAGWIQPAHRPELLPPLLRRAEQWAQRGAQVEVLDAKACAERIGTAGYHGGWIDKRAGGIQPLGYARGLARAAAAAGARLHGSTPALRLTRQGDRWRIETPRGAVLAGRVVLATNAYTDALWPGLQRTVVPVHGFQVATRPLSDNIAKSILPARSVLSDTRRVAIYYRVDPDGRLLMGGRGRFREPTGPDDFALLQRAIRGLFPQAAEAPIEHRWFGRVAITTDHLPHLHEPAPGVLAGLGYNGRGIGMATAMGTLLARRLAGEELEALPLPAQPVRPIPLHGFHRLGVAATIAYYRLRDRFG
jgi:glycine/D-amino acid oxidase-like deaminating enzyme